MIRELLGIPFAYGGRDPAKGLDCYGLVIEYYRRLGLSAPDVASYSEGVLQSEPDAFHALRPQAWQEIDGEPKDGDVVTIFSGGNVTHCGILVGKNILHTSQKTGSLLTPLRRLKSRIEGFYRLCRG